MSVDRDRVERSGNDNTGQRMMRTNSRTIREILNPRTTLIYTYRSASERQPSTTILSSKSSSSKLFNSFPVVRSASQLYSSSCASQCLSSLLSKHLVVFALIKLSGRLFQIFTVLCVKKFLLRLFAARCSCSVIVVQIRQRWQKCVVDARCHFENFYYVSSFSTIGWQLKFLEPFSGSQVFKYWNQFCGSPLTGHSRLLLYVSFCTDSIYCWHIPEYIQ